MALVMLIIMRKREEMFDDLLKELKKMEQGIQVSVPIRADEKGYVDKQCPNEDCEFIFKINEEDWANICTDEAIWCPFCGHVASSDHWFTKDQLEHAENEVFEVFQGRIDKAIKSGATKFNRSLQKGGLLSLSVKIQGGSNRTFVIPAEAKELMQLEIECAKCTTRFCVIGSAYFCPACGYNSVERTFADSLRKIQAKKQSLELIRESIGEALDRDEAELVCRSLIETSVSDAVTAFQKYCDGLYSVFGNPPMNAFQRLEQGSDLWKSAIDLSYDQVLTGDELRELNTLFQKRHLLEHQDGIVDEKYVTRVSESTLSIGQRIVVSTTDVDNLVSLIQKLSTAIGKAVEQARQS